VLLYDVSPRRDGLYLEDDREQVRLVHVTKDNAAAAPELQKLYQEKELALVVDDLNKLYVALTRAEEEMYILSVKSRRTKVPSEFFPETGYEPQAKPIVERREPKSRIVVTLSHDVPHVTTHPAEYDSIPLHETKRGEFIHAVLEQIEYADDHLDKRLREAINRASALRPFKIETQAVYDLLFTAINLPDLLGYFTKRPGRKILNEQEFVTHDGSLTRMDRVVIDPDSVTVLDYKTGDEKADYAKQVSNYMETLRDLFKNRSVHGLLVYLDRKTVRAIP
jgi:ATP-dependent helicase/nuclease subunit A